MKLKLNSILFVLLLFIPFLNIAQTESALQIMDDVRSHYNSDYSFEADFTIEIDIPEAETTVMDGKLSLMGDNFKFTTPELTLISDDINLWYWTKTNTIDEVQITYIEETEEALSPSDVFGVYLKGFVYKLVSETKFEGRNLALIELTPVKRSNENTYFKVKTVVNKDNDTIEELQVFYKDGTVYTFEVKNEKNKTFSKDYFSFDTEANKDTEVIDLR